MTVSQFEHYHPLFTRKREDWTLLDDAYEGQTRIKGKTTEYLMATSGQLALGMGNGTFTSGSKEIGFPRPGQLLYDAYIARAIFPDVVRATVQALVGLMVREAWTVELPPNLKGMIESATDRGESMAALIDKILENVLLSGRTGLLLDVDEERDLPYIVAYKALQIINWDDTPEGSSTVRVPTMAVLDETKFERTGASLQWKEERSFRKLDLQDGRYTATVERQGVELDPVQPEIQGQGLERLPFVFVNATDLVPQPGEVPLIGLARLAVAIYRGEADYRHSLFMQGQDTLVLQGVANPNEQDVPDLEGHVSAEDQMRARGSNVVVGAGAVLYLPDPEMDAKFIGVTSNGLSEQRESLQNDYERAAQFGMSLLTSGSGVEAAETLKVRVAARTASLASIAKTAAAGLLEVLRIGAEWAGENPDDVKVEPNLDFVDNPMTPEELLKLVETKMRGMPLSWKSIHENARRGGITNMSLDDERREIQDEPAPDPGSGGIGEEDPDPGPQDRNDGSQNQNSEDDDE